MSQKSMIAQQGLKPNDNPEHILSCQIVITTLMISFYKHFFWVMQGDPGQLAACTLN